MCCAPDETRFHQAPHHRYAQSLLRAKYASSPAEEFILCRFKEILGTPESWSGRQREAHNLFAPAKFITIC